MLDRLASLTHLLRMLVEPVLNGFKNVLMLHRLIRRCLAVVQLFLMAQRWQALVK
jgi:hypothetical protein